MSRGRRRHRRPHRRCRLLLLLLLLGLLPNQPVGIGQPLPGGLAVQQFLLGAAEQLPPLGRESRQAGRDGLAAGQVGLPLLVQERLALLRPVGIEELDAHVLRQLVDGDRPAADGIDHVRRRRRLLAVGRRYHPGLVRGVDADVLVVVAGSSDGQGLLRPGHAHLGILLHLHRRRLLLPIIFLLHRRRLLLRILRRHHRHGFGRPRHPRLHHLIDRKVDGLDHHKVVPIDPVCHGRWRRRRRLPRPALLGGVPLVFGPVCREGQRFGPGFCVGCGTTGGVAGGGQRGGQFGQQLIPLLITSTIATLLGTTTTTTTTSASTTSTGATTVRAQQRPVSVHQCREVRERPIPRL